MYEAVHRNGARAAIKMLHPEVNESQIMRDAFVREAWVANSIDHPGVPRVLDDDIDEDGTVYLVMEQFAGVSLARRARLRLFDEIEALEVSEQLLEILEAAHDRGIVHCDIKPHNVLVDEQGRIALIDFGVARATSRVALSGKGAGNRAGDGASTRDTCELTFGTAGYMAPEQALAQQVGGHTDLWALGAMLFVLMTGESIYLACDVDELLVATAQEQPRSLSEPAPWVATDVIAIVDRALQRDVDARYRTAAEMLADVIAAKERRGFPSVPLLAAQPTRKISSRIRKVQAPPAVDEKIA